MFPDFRPLPFLKNPHLQTILGNWLRGPAFPFPVHERRVQLADGDQLILHDSIPNKWHPGGQIALLVHGMGGCHHSGYMQRVAALLYQRGVRAVRMDLRGCGRGITLARKTYNGGCSEDVRTAVEVLQRDNPESPVSLVGFSLGGNIVLKLAGEAATRPVPGLARVVAVAPPIDLEQCSQMIERRQNRLYELYFLRDLLALVRARRRCCADEPAVCFPRRMSLRVFDDLYTAPRGGFADALDYYRRSRCLPLIPQIQVPTLILTARDDPFVAVEPFESLTAPPNVEIQITEYGGHMGFVGADGNGGIRWADRRVVEWVVKA